MLYCELDKLLFLFSLIFLSLRVVQTLTINDDCLDSYISLIIDLILTYLLPDYLTRGRAKRDLMNESNIHEQQWHH